MEWDWSTAGQDIEEDHFTYLKIKGSFVYERNFTPEYYWYNGNSDRYILGDEIDIHADSNSSYDPPQAIRVGRMLEDVGAIYFEEPCPFDHLEDTKRVADTLDIPVAGGEQSVEALEQARPRAPVGGQRVLRGPFALDQTLPRRQVGLHVGVAKTVDCLLRIADHEQALARLVAVDEDRLENVPLDRVGVLELVDERVGETLTQRLAQQAGARAGLVG